MERVVRPLLWEMIQVAPKLLFSLELISLGIRDKVTGDVSYLQAYLESLNLNSHKHRQKLLNE
jgi:hypothetical protein